MITPIHPPWPTLGDGTTASVASVITCRTNCHGFLPLSSVAERFGPIELGPPALRLHLPIQNTHLHNSLFPGQWHN